MQLGGYQRNVRDALGYLNAADPSSPDTFWRSNLPRVGLTDSAGDTGHVALADAVMTSVAVYLHAGDLVTNLSFTSGATAVGTPANWWFALYSDAATPALLAQTADQTSTAWAANTTKTLALATAQRITRSGIYWASVMVNSTSVCTLLGAIGQPAIVTGERNLSVSSGSTLTDTAPPTIATPTAKNFIPRVVIT
ncbi:hypothetical protein O7627_24390 [Solwaraspora sp. WMMD1047]|uniref:hypothetical protein n=1 Tax=Solwaraspora sp. WMMD1047 TaxID=3016102 RepID=UPI002415E836|nr:hypothetical protein [Solwaraspora sp. WMMD1047]MDG4832423.1 hypothetical protein [Solwaraspora sp. WMMD1047]